MPAPDESTAQNYGGQRWQRRASNTYDEMAPASQQQWGDLQQALWKRQQGQAPSVAQLQQQAGLGQMQQQGATMSAQGGGDPLSAFLGARAGAGGATGVIGQAGAGRAQEQAQVEGQMAQNQAHKDNLTLSYMQAGLSQADADRKAQQDMYDIQLNAWNEKQQQKERRQKKMFDLWGTGVKTIGNLVPLSDKTAKKDINKTSAEDYEEFLKELKGYNYKYRESHKPGDERTYSGIMAQDLEKSKIGRRLVVVKEIPVKRKGAKSALEDVKHIDITGLTAALAGALEHVNAKLEAKNASK